MNFAKRRFEADRPWRYVRRTPARRPLARPHVVLEQLAHLVGVESSQTEDIVLPFFRRDEPPMAAFGALATRRFELVVLQRVRSTSYEVQ